MGKLVLHFKPTVFFCVIQTLHSHGFIPIPFSVHTYTKVCPCFTEGIVYTYKSKNMYIWHHLCKNELSIRVTCMGHLCGTSLNAMIEDAKHATSMNLERFVWGMENGTWNMFFQYIASVRCRCRTVIKADGGHTRYWVVVLDLFHRGYLQISPNISFILQI